MDRVRSKALAQLRKLHTSAANLEQLDGARIQQWQMKVEICLARLFGQDSVCIKKFRDISWPVNFADKNALAGSSDAARMVLQTAIDDATEYPVVTSTVPTTAFAQILALIHGWPVPLKVGGLTLLVIIAGAYASWSSLPDISKRRLLHETDLSPGTTQKQAAPRPSPNRPQSVVHSAAVTSSIPQQTNVSNRQPPSRGPVNVQSNAALATNNTDTRATAAQPPQDELRRITGEWLSRYQDKQFSADASLIFEADLTSDNYVGRLLVTLTAPDPKATALPTSLDIRHITMRASASLNNDIISIQIDRGKVIDAKSKEQTPTNWFDGIYHVEWLNPNTFKLVDASGKSDFTFQRVLK